jgi:hypothetical protein
LFFLYVKIPGRYTALIYLGIGLVFLAVVWRLGFVRMTPDEKAAANRYLDRHRPGRKGVGR